MEASARRPDPWKHTLANLLEPRPPHVSKVNLVSGDLNSSRRNTPRTDRTSSRRCFEHIQPSSCVKISILERFDRVAVIWWCDPTACNYSDQTWRRMLARRSGTCALTGAQISSGDDVFMPATRKAKPINYGAMILTSALPVVSSV
jgi:Domain of unknown function (DUF3331)